jgi:pimeloyl-ACP methyl ester carboxylesterase
VSTIHLIHGAWHGRWCWEKLIPKLERNGHPVVARDLPGLGLDRTPATQITLQAYADAVSEALAKEVEPAVLVGHSMGGIIISEVAERMPEKIKSLVYLTAYLPASGQSLMELATSDPETAEGGKYLLIDGLTCTIRPDVIRELVYGNCTPEDAARATRLLVPQPLIAFSTPVHVTGERFGRIPKFYIQCSQDRILSPSLQRKMAVTTPCEQIFSIDADHSPFLSAPDELASQLLHIASRFL